MFLVTINDNPGGSFPPGFSQFVQSTSNIQIRKAMKTYIGIDNGVTGALAVIAPDENWLLQPVRTIPSGKGNGRLLDIFGNLDLLQDLIAQAGGIESVVIACEHQKMNPKFGTKGNFANGRNGEFWRVLLGLSRIPFVSVFPDTWQKDVLNGVSGDNAKERAKLYVAQRFPRVDLSSYGEAKRLGIRDAMCIAMWARCNGR